MLDDRFATPAYVLLLVTGFLLIWEADIPIGTLWISGGLILYGVLVVAAIAFYRTRAQTPDPPRRIGAG